MAKKEKSSDSGVEEVFFFGEYQHSLDDQRRVAIPKSWRKKTGEDSFFLVPGRDKSLMLIPHESFREFLIKAQKISFANRQAQAALAKLGAQVKECNCDRQGRIQIPQKMLESLEVNEQVMLIGAFTNIQIWSPEAWEKSQGNGEEYLDEVQKIGEKGDDISNLMQAVINKDK